MEFMAGGTRERHTRHRQEENVTRISYGSLQWRWRGVMPGMGKGERTCTYTVNMGVRYEEGFF